MAKRKDYLRLFLKYCRGHSLYFTVCANGFVGEIKFNAERQDGYDTFSYWDTMYGFPHGQHRLGTKAAYEWLLKAHEEAEK